jgi:Winged helix-turn-helix DNA-binding
MSRETIAAPSPARSRPRFRSSALPRSRPPRCPSGRVAIIGAVLWVEEVEVVYRQTNGINFVRDAWRMRVRDNRGFEVLGTVPKFLLGIKRGGSVEFVATVKPSKDDPSFGFFSRPRPANALRERVFAVMTTRPTSTHKVTKLVGAATMKNVRMNLDELHRSGLIVKVPSGWKLADEKDQAIAKYINDDPSITDVEIARRVDLHPQKVRARLRNGRIGPVTSRAERRKRRR